MATLPEIIQNVDNVYDGDLTHYFRNVFTSANNLKNPYHNFRHMFHVAWLCYDACIFYKDKLVRRDIRNLLIAAIFHDFNHSGKSGNDDLNIELAIRGLRKFIHPDDANQRLIIEGMIRSTEFPHVIPVANLTFLEKILRDADLSQGLSPVWVQEIIFGLSSEMCVTPVEVFKMQEGFLSKLEFCTEWARLKFPKSLIDEKKVEAQKYFEIIS